MGRRREENFLLRQFFERADAPESAYLCPEGFVGPDAVLVGPVTEAALESAGALLLRYTRRLAPQNARVRVTQAESTRLIEVRPNPAVQTIPTL